MNNKILTENVLKIIWICENKTKEFKEEYYTKNHEILIDNIEHVNKSFSGSWIGYHSCIYYKDFETPPPGDMWDKEWGPDGYSHTRGEWFEYSREAVVAVCLDGVDADYPNKLDTLSDSASEIFDECQDTLLAIVDALLEERETESLKRLKVKLSKIQGKLSVKNIASALGGKGTHSTRDQRAIASGAQIVVPQHITVQSIELSRQSIFHSLKELITCSNRLLKYMEIHNMVEHQDSSLSGEKIFIGHGRSTDWKDLSAFIRDRLKKDYEEFNRSSAAGYGTVERLQEMLNNSCFAFLIMTPEDLDNEGKKHARENVVHEIGLFQGRLGFRRAIILMEDGCEEFSNIVGLTQIRYSKGNIKGTFEEVRAVLEREGIIKCLN